MSKFTFLSLFILNPFKADFQMLNVSLISTDKLSESKTLDVTLCPSFVHPNYSHAKIHYRKKPQPSYR